MVGRLKKSLLLGIGLSALGLGCTALLGSFDVDPNAATFNPDGSADGPNPNGEGGLSLDANPDAPFSGDANELLLNCGVSNIKPLEEITDPLLEFDPRLLRVFRGGNTNNIVRVVTRLKPPGNNDTPIGLRTYGLDLQGGGGGGVVVGKFETTAGQVVDVRRQAGQLTALALQQDGNGNGRLFAFTLPDADLIKLGETAISRDFGLIQTRRPTGALGVYPNSNGEFFYAVTVSAVGASATSQVVTGHKTDLSTPAPSPAASGPEGPNLNVKELARTAAGVFVFNERGPEPSRPRDSTAYIVVPDNGIVPNPPATLNPIVPNPQKGYVVAAASATATGGLRLAVGEVDFSGQGSPLIIRAGEISGAALTQPLDASRLPAVFQFGSLLEAPLGGPETRFVNDELVWIGSPPDPQQGQGLNFAWIDLKTNAARAKELGPKRLLVNRSSIVAASVGFGGPPTGISADFDLVWIEQGLGARKSLFYGEIRCVK